MTHTCSVSEIVSGLQAHGRGSASVCERVLEAIGHLEGNDEQTRERFKEAGICEGMPVCACVSMLPWVDNAVILCLIQSFVLSQ